MLEPEIVSTICNCDYCYSGPLIIKEPEGYVYY